MHHWSPLRAPRGCAGPMQPLGLPGALLLQDAWSDAKGHLHMDSQQDYQLLGAQSAAEGLYILFRRAFSTCDPRDYLIEVRHRPPPNPTAPAPSLQVRPHPCCVFGMALAVCAAQCSNEACYRCQPHAMSNVWHPLFTTPYKPL